MPFLPLPPASLSRVATRPTARLRDAGTAGAFDAALGETGEASGAATEISQEQSIVGSSALLAVQSWPQDRPRKGRPLALVQQQAMRAMKDLQIIFLNREEGNPDLTALSELAEELEDRPDPSPESRLLALRLRVELEKMALVRRC